MASIINNLQGFPKTASEAVEFSYFLSESEKAEWREWIKTATPIQQEELVDILYSMWEDNQKNAVPENLANNQAIANQQPVNNQVFTNQGNFNNQTNQPLNDFVVQPEFQNNFNPYPQPQPKPVNPPQQYGVQDPVFNPQFNNNPPIQQFQPTQFDPNTFVNPIQPAVVNQPLSNQNFINPPIVNPPNNNFAPVRLPENQVPVAPVSQFTQSLPTPKNDFEPIITQPSKVVSDIITPQKFDTITDQNQFELSQPEPLQPTPLPDTIQSIPQISEPDNFDSSPQAVATKVVSDFTTPNFDFDDSDSVSNPPIEDKVGIKEVTPEPKAGNSEINMESLVNDNKYTPNPILNDDDGEEFNFKKDVELQNAEKAATRKAKTAVAEASEDDSEYDFNFDSSKIPASSGDDTIKFDNLKNSGSRDMLNEIYNEYIKTNDLNEKKFTSFLDYITKVLSSYEQISEHFEKLTGKVIDINDKIVSQAKDIQALKEVTHTQSGSSIQDQVDDLRYDLDNLEKDLRSLRTESRRKTSEINQQMVAIGASSYPDGGINQKIELLKSEIQNLKQGLGDKSQTDKINDPNSVPTKSSKLDLTGVI